MSHSERLIATLMSIRASSILFAPRVLLVSSLVVSVSTPDETVRVRVPLAVVAAIVESYDGESFGFAQAASALRASPGELVHVTDAENQVNISIW